MDQCSCGLCTYKNGRLMGKVRKHTRFQTTKQLVAHAVHSVCRCTEKHVLMDAVPNTRQTQN